MRKTGQVLSVRSGGRSTSAPGAASPASFCWRWTSREGSRPCSHLPPIGGLEELPGLWTASHYLERLRRRVPDTCLRCPRADLCRGGCPAVAAGDGDAVDGPDRELPCTGTD